MKIVIAYSADPFNGEGVKAAGQTEKAARIALFKEYKKRSAAWNADGKAFRKTRKAFEEWYSWNTWLLDTDDLNSFSGSMEL